jgi:hypothetical protein
VLATGETENDFEFKLPISEKHKKHWQPS